MLGERWYRRFLRWVTSSSAGGNTFDTLDQELREEMLADAATTTAEFLPSLRPPTGEHLRRRRLLSIRCPVHILVGERSNPWFRRAAIRLARSIPGARVEEIPRATHSLPWEAPDAVAHHVDDVAAHIPTPAA